MLNIIKSVLVMLFVTASLHVDALLVRRAAFDFGSGKIKMQVADVETDTGKIVFSVYTDDVVVLLSEDAAKSPEGSFSEEVQKRALAATSKLKQKALDLGATQFRGLATEAYRKASNGKDLIGKYLSELQIPVEIISQTAEGVNGFLALVTENNLNPKQVVSWDIGGGSFQVTYVDDAGEIQVYMAPFGRSTTKNAILTHVKAKDFTETMSPNPMNQIEWETTLEFFSKTLPEVPSELILKLKREDVRLIGMSAHPEKLRNLKTYHMADVDEALSERLNKSDEELTNFHKAPIYALSELALVYSVMKKLDVVTVNYIRTNSGFTSALLVSKDFWHVDP